MRVLFATMQFGRGYAQGTERYLDVLAAGLQARGHEVVILAGDPEHRGPPRRLGDPIQSQPRTLHYPTRDWTAVRGLPAEVLVPLLRRERPDIVHLANPAHIGVGLIPAAKLARVPLVITVVDFWWLCPKHTLWHCEQRICTGDVPWTTCVRCLDAGDPRPAIHAPARWPLARHVLPPAFYSFVRGDAGQPSTTYCAGRTGVGCWPPLCGRPTPSSFCPIRRGDDWPATWSRRVSTPLPWGWNRAGSPSVTPARHDRRRKIQRNSYSALLERWRNTRVRICCSKRCTNYAGMRRGCESPAVLWIRITSSGCAAWPRVSRSNSPVACRQSTCLPF